jgi:alkanesulfonate monooxygenase
MVEDVLGAQVEVFSTCPPIRGEDRAYLERVADAARWSEQAGCRGMLVYADNSQLDAWLVSQTIVENTQALSPLVAVQPAYMHPYTVAKMVTSLGYLYRRRVYLNMVAGGFKNDLAALNDTTHHDKRYERLVEYTTIIRRLLAGASAVTHRGKFYTVDKLRLTPPLAAISTRASSCPGPRTPGWRRRARSAPPPFITRSRRRRTRLRLSSKAGESGVRVGIIAREREEDAWRTAHARFPEDRVGQLTHQLAMKVSDSVWHGQLSALGEASGPYWLVPFQNYKTMCPYLVGSYEQVAAELRGYLAAGYRTFILDVPPDREELRHVAMAFAQVRKEARCQNFSRSG